MTIELEPVIYSFFGVVISILIGMIAYFLTNIHKRFEVLESKYNEQAMKIEVMRSEFMRHTTDVSEMKSDIKAILQQNARNENINQAVIQELQSIIREINIKLDKK